MHLTIIAKAPIAGRVKTRLCPPCTPEQAAAITAAALRDTIRAVDAVAELTGVARTLLLDGEPMSWMPPLASIVAQRGDGLAERLANGFCDLGPGLIVGMETPHAVPVLADAIDALRRDVDVIGLATDGGYWVIGLGPTSARQADRVFDGIPMSSTRTGIAQLRRLHEMGRRVRTLPSARDLDTIDDLRAVACSTRDGELPAAARAALGMLG